MNVHEQIKAKKQIGDMYEIIKRALPRQIVGELEFVPPHPCNAGKNDIMRGQILGPRGKGIWNRKECFYEIGIGDYRGAPNSPPSVGVGFWSAPNQKICGGPKIRPDILRVLAALDQRDGNNNGGKFRISPPQKPRQGAFSYYPRKQFRSIPQAVADLVVLISMTFPDFNRLTRHST